MKILGSKNKAKNEKKWSRPAKTTGIKQEKKKEEKKAIKETISVQTEVITETIEEKPSETLKDSAIEQDDFETTSKISKYAYKWLVSKKLTILLLETTAEVAVEKENIIKIFKSLVTSGMLVVINYGSHVTVSETFDVSNFNNNTDFSYYEVTGNEACLYDALVELENVVSKMYMRMEETDKEKILIKNIEIIGIGTCKDNHSKVSKEMGIDSFTTATSKPDIATKYFCITDANFIDAAEIGFRSIGAISKKYQ